MHVCVCVYVHMYVCRCACVCMLCVHLRVWMCVCMYVCAFACVFGCMYVCLHVCLWVMCTIWPWCVLSARSQIPWRFLCMIHVCVRVYEKFACDVYAQSSGGLLMCVCVRACAEVCVCCLSRNHSLYLCVCVHTCTSTACYIRMRELVLVSVCAYKWSELCLTVHNAFKGRVQLSKCRLKHTWPFEGVSCAVLCSV